MVKTWKFISAALFWIISQAMFGRTDVHMETRIIFIFANVVFLEVSYVTYCRETRDTNNAMRERVNQTFDIMSSRKSELSVQFIHHGHWRECPPTYDYTVNYNTLPLLHTTTVQNAVVGKVTVIKLLRYVTSYFLSNLLLSK
jgi:hypothetical protein